MQGPRQRAQLRTVGDLRGVDAEEADAELGAVGYERGEGVAVGDVPDGGDKRPGAGGEGVDSKSEETKRYQPGEEPASREHGSPSSPP